MEFREGLRFNISVYSAIMGVRACVEAGFSMGERGNHR
jgi:hypothetical protein